MYVCKARAGRNYVGDPERPFGALSDRYSWTFLGLGQDVQIFSGRVPKLRITTEELWRCMYRASYYNVYINQRDAQILVNNLYFFVKWLYMFRTIISPSPGATFKKLYSAIGTFVPVPYVWLLYTAVRLGYLHECTNCTVQLIKCCSWWWTNYSPKHVQPFNEKIKIIHKNLCISFVYTHIAIWCTVHTTSNLYCLFWLSNVGVFVSDFRQLCSKTHSNEILSLLKLL